MGLTPLTYSDELNQGVIEEGAFRKKEAAPWTQVMEEEQVLLLKENVVMDNYLLPLGPN